MTKSFQSKVYSIVFYDDTDIQTRLFDLILSKQMVAFAYIKHDKDVDDNGEIKKTHYHLYIEFAKRISDQFIRNYFNTEIVTKCYNKNYYISYFIHLYDKDKYQYDRENIVAYNINIDQCINNVAITSDDEIELLNDLINYIYVNNCNFYEVFHYAMRNGLFYIYKSNYIMIRDIIKSNQGERRET